MNRGIALLVKNDLRHATAVAQIDEDQVAEVASPVYPAHEHGLFT